MHSRHPTRRRSWHLAGAPALLELPADHPRPPQQTYRGARKSFILPKDLADAAKALSRKEGATLFMTLLAAFDVLIARCTGQEDIVVGSPIANRKRTEVEGLIGYFSNAVVLRTDVSGNPTFRKLIRRVRPAVLGADDNQDVPFERLVLELDRKRDMSYTPLFQVMFVLQNAPLKPLALPGLTLTPVRIAPGTAKFDWTFSLWEEEGPEGRTLHGSCEYSTDLFDEGTITRMIGHYRTLLAAAVADPAAPVRELPLLTEPERRQLLVEWNRTETRYPAHLCIHQEIEEQAACRPEAPAGRAAEMVLSLAQLSDEEIEAMLAEQEPQSATA